MTYEFHLKRRRHRAEAAGGRRRRSRPYRNRPGPPRAEKGEQGHDGAWASITVVSFQNSNGSRLIRGVVRVLR